MDPGDNQEIMQLLNSRFLLGKETYGHGVIVDTEKYNWELMALEEALDGMIYVAAAIIKLRRKQALLPKS